METVNLQRLVDHFAAGHYYTDPRFGVRVEAGRVHLPPEAGAWRKLSDAEKDPYRARAIEELKRLGIVETNS